MATILVDGVDVFSDFTNGQGVGATQYADYAVDLDTSFTSLIATINQLINEVRGVQGPNQTLPLDILQLSSAILGPELEVIVGTASYFPDFISTTQVDVTAGVAILLNQRVQANSGVSLSPVVGTDFGGTRFAFIALDANGAVTINTTAGAQQLDLWRVEVNVAGTLFVDNLERVGTWFYTIDADATAEAGDATSVGGTTFPDVPDFGPLAPDYPYGIKDRINRLERLASGFVTDLQTVAETIRGSGAQTIGPLVVPGGSIATPGLIFGDGTGTAEVGTGLSRFGANRFGASSNGFKSLEFDAAGNMDLPLNSRVKGRRTAAQTIADGGALTSVTFTAADDFDLGSWHDPGGGSPENFVVPTDDDGTYIITASIEWAEAVTNIRDITVEIQVGGTLIAGGKSSARLEVGEDHASTVTILVVLTAANVVRVQVSQDDTVGALGLDVIDASLSIVKIA